MKSPKCHSVIFPMLVCALCGPMQAVQGQTLADSAHLMPVVEVTAAKARQAPVGANTTTWDAAQLEKLPAGDIAQLLSAETATYIKSYGQGSLATSSLRGGSANHTLVLWNGLPVQSPMLGQLDLSLLPVQSVESVSLSTGGNTAMWGGGAVGGVLNLDNHPDFSTKVALKSSSQAGSFGQWGQGLHIGLGNASLQSRTRFSHFRAENDFSYFPAPGLPERRQTNARLRSNRFMQELYWRAGGGWRLSARYWWQDTNRQIPPTNVQTRSLAQQRDRANRLALEMGKAVGKVICNAKFGFFDEHLDYYDELNLQESPSHFRTFLGELTGQWQWRQHRFLAGNTHTHVRAWSDGFKEGPPTEYKTALFASWNFAGEKYAVQASLRQGLAGGGLLPFVPAAGFELAVRPTLVLKGRVSRNYRLPTLNDRFWQPGGNAGLLPESGWSEELGLAKVFAGKGFGLEASATVFNRNMKDWIFWTQQEGQAYWSAANITKVWSRGVEPRLSLSGAFGGVEIGLKAGYDYVRSTNRIDLGAPKLAAGEQLPYTPVHQAFGTFSIDWKGLHFAYRHAYKGAANGLNDPVEAFQTGNLRLQYALKLDSFSALAYVNVNNIWDAGYLVVERRPMPGINFETGLQFHFQKNNQE